MSSAKMADILFQPWYVNPLVPIDTFVWGSDLPPVQLQAYFK